MISKFATVYRNILSVYTSDKIVIEKYFYNVIIIDYLK